MRRGTRNTVCALLKDLSSILRNRSLNIMDTSNSQVPTKYTLAKVSSPSNTRSALGAARSCSFISKDVLKAQADSPTPFG